MMMHVNLYLLLLKYNFVVSLSMPPVFGCGRVCGCVCVCYSQLVDCVPLLSLSLTLSPSLSVSPSPIPCSFHFISGIYPYYYNHILLRKNIRRWQNGRETGNHVVHFGCCPTNSRISKNKLSHERKEINTNFRNYFFNGQNHRNSFFFSDYMLGYRVNGIIVHV